MNTTIQTDIHCLVTFDLCPLCDLGYLQDDTNQECICKEYLSSLNGPDIDLRNDPNLWKCIDDKNEDFTFSADLEIHELETAYLMMSRIMQEYIEFSSSAPQLLSMPTKYDVSPQPLTRPHSPHTVQWLLDNFEEKPGVSLKRNGLYVHYLDYCHIMGMCPVNAASFGKILRSVFPHIKTRRLGNRGQSKYHYYGITIKESSPYKDVIRSFQKFSYNISNQNHGAVSRMFDHDSNNIDSESLKSGIELSALLPHFPCINQIRIPTELHQKMTVFLQMYRKHLNGMLDLIIRAELMEIREHLHSFWTHLPAFVQSTLTSPAVIDVVSLCDLQTYSAIAEILIPNPLQPLPNSLQIGIRKFAEDLPIWLAEALKSFPEQICSAKLEVAKAASKLLHRRASLVHITTATRETLSNREMMMQDWMVLEHKVVLSDCAVLRWSLPGRHYRAAEKYIVELRRLVLEESSMERYIGWIDTLFHLEVSQKCEQHNLPLRIVMSNFLMRWNIIMASVTKEICLAHLPTYGSFLLLSILLTDYIRYQAQKFEMQRREMILMRSVCTDEESNMNLQLEGSHEEEENVNDGDEDHIENFLGKVTENEHSSSTVWNSLELVHSALPEKIFASPTSSHVVS